MNIVAVLSDLQTSLPQLNPFTVLPSYQQHVMVYISTLRAVNENMGTKALQEWKVVKAEHLKSKKISQHEYMQVRVLDPRNQTTFLAFERLGGEPADVPKPISESCPDLSRPPLKRSKTSLSSLSSLSSCLSNNAAQDVVTPLTSGHGKLQQGDEVVGTLTFLENKSPSLHEVALLAGIIHEGNNQYLLFSNNCYHYAGTMMLVLAAEYSPDMDTPENAHAGTWCGIDLRTNKVPTGLHQLFKDKVESFVRFLSMSSNQLLMYLGL